MADRPKVNLNAIPGMRCTHLFRFCRVTDSKTELKNTTDDAIAPVR